MPSALAVLAFALASAVIIAIPGPSILFTIGRALSSGHREAVLTVAGNALGVQTQIIGLGVGLGPVIAASETAYTVLKVVGAGYLVWLGVQASGIDARPRRPSWVRSRRRPRRCTRCAPGSPSA